MAAAVRVEEVQPEICLVTLDRPERRNALSADMLIELKNVLGQIAEDVGVRVVILTGAGDAFCAGLDFQVLQGLMQGNETRGPVQGSMHGLRSITSIITSLRTMPQPVIAAVNGAAAGAGLALALACDTRLCAPTASFSAAFVRLGVSGCDLGLSYLLPRIVGPTSGFEMMLTGRYVDASEACERGLALRVAEQGTVVEAGIDLAESIRANSPFGVWMTKETMWAGLEASNLQGAIEMENRTQTLASQTADAREAIQAFLEKRGPKFANR